MSCTTPGAPHAPPSSTKKALRAHLQSTDDLIYTRKRPSQCHHTIVQRFRIAENRTAGVTHSHAGDCVRPRGRNRPFRHATSPPTARYTPQHLLRKSPVGHVVSNRDRLRLAKHRPGCISDSFSEALIAVLHRGNPRHPALRAGLARREHSLLFCHVPHISLVLNDLPQPQGPQVFAQILPHHVTANHHAQFSFGVHLDTVK